MVPNQPKQIKRCPNLGTLAIVNLTKTVYLDKKFAGQNVVCIYFDIDTHENFLNIMLKMM